MTTSIVTKTLNKLNAELIKDYSLGFKRLIVLPKRVRNAFNLSCIVNMNMDTTEYIIYQKNYLEALTEQEYKNWLRAA